MAIMSRPMLLALVLLVLFLTSQTDWLEQTKTVPESNVATKPQQVHTERQLIKEQIILIQEKRIYILNQLVKNLQHQLSLCQGNVSHNPTTENLQFEVENEGQNSIDLQSSSVDSDDMP
ncbi:hypothetical protein O6H91_01G013000 [Diphasiastrum complanatum]|uniref:Uncharacterized protein n=1 Tax=Diphasiastrum complanatum TaxID=34168 RepID=A0ACC2EN42_DIPCM|nr:hypothetical protein O6H91_01G013000 [Diphasiastrum complanatum]